MRRHVKVIAVLAAFALLGAACGDDDDTPARDGGSSTDPDAGPVVDVPFGLDSRPVNATCRAPAGREVVDRLRGHRRQEGRQHALVVVGPDQA